jgi:hypothetical protein
VKKTPWKIFITGTVISLLLSAAPQFQYVFSQSVISQAENISRYFASIFPESLNLVATLRLYYPVISLLLSIIIVLSSVIVMLLRASSGFYLNGIGLKPLYLPGKFKEAITFIRDFQDNHKQEDAKS